MTDGGGRVREGGPGAIPIDVAVIQPLRYSLETWLALRHALSDLVSEEREASAERALPAGASLHVHHTSFGQFAGELDGFASMREAFPEVLAETRDHPCLVLPLEEPAAALSAGDDGSGIEGLRWTGADTRLLLDRKGEAVLLTLLSGRLDAGAMKPERRCPQREVRDVYLEALARCLPRLADRIDGAVGTVLGSPPGASAADVLEESGGHLLTVVHAADAAAVGPLKRAHLIQEGTADDQSGLLLGERERDGDFARFGWAYSTIATPRRAAAYRTLFPVVAVNLAWYRYRQLRGDVIELSRQIHRLETDEELMERTEFYNQVVLDFKIWEAERDAYERGLRPRYRTVYDAMWAYWDTDESRGVVQDGIAYVREFLDRKYSVKIAVRERSQSRILFVLTILQLFGVFGLVTSYLYFWEVTPLDEARLFEAPWFQWAFVVGAPILIVVVFVGLLVHFLREHR